MESIMEWIGNNHEALFAAVTAVVTIASLIASLTPTPKDDNWVAKLYKVVDFLAINIGKAKETGADKKK